jgi:glycosyltransferase involved in cell wall biosynthesis
MRIFVAAPTLGINSEVWILRQMDGLVSMGHDVSALCWRREGFSPQEQTDCPVFVLPNRLKGPMGAALWLDRAKNAVGRNFQRGSKDEEANLTKLLGEQKPDVILCHFGYVALRLLPIAKRLGIRVVTHFHGLDLSSMLTGRWYRWSLQSHVNSFAQNIVVGSHQARLLRSYGVPEDRLNLIPCGVPTGQFEPKPRPRRSHVRFIQVSRIVAWKGIEQGLRAFAAVHAKLPDTRLTFVGDGDQREVMTALAKSLGLEQVVDFTGPLPPSRVVEELQQSDVFIHHSLTHHTGWCEGFGVSLAEAAAMELPVIATNSGGIPDQVLDGQTGLLVEERDVEAMSRAMLNLAESADRRESLGKAGRERMIEHFDAAGQIAKLESALRHAADVAKE